MKKIENQNEMYTHEQYRKAGVAQILTEEQTFEFYYHGKPIESSEANIITYQYLKGK